MLCIANGIQKKVFSLDIERILLQNPMVENCAVVPIDHAELCQAPVAFVILKSDFKATDTTEAELRAYSETKLDDVYRPLKYIFVEKFPFTQIGKVDYLALEREAASIKI